MGNVPYGYYACEDGTVRKIKAMYQCYGGHQVEFVPVVRCKDCKYSVEIGSYGFYCRKEDSPWFNDTFEVYMDVDDFCSYGERKDGDGNG